MTEAHDDLDVETLYLCGVAERMYRKHMLQEAFKKFNELHKKGVIIATW